MIKLFWGAPANPGQMRFHTGTLLSKPIGETRRMARKHFATNEITALYGLQVGKSFVGRIAMGRRGFENGAYEPEDTEGRDA
ncbi:hypothetical protein [Tianweitania sediminis]|uniref:Uncharacterized protein n=1 Tax=Tianweitania sediminis TaxID=1502156 RepID=A0A8J7R410_9HYPH|nr:hypothetical protein [Tianweitania sediminis]MBP0440638.1 hypothetical protein [Tianweitania sediminis]